MAQFGLGAMYHKGQGVPQDIRKQKWHTLAAEQGDEWAQHNLGVSYYTGQGVPQDYVRARMWFNLAASKGKKKSVKSREHSCK